MEPECLVCSNEIYFLLGMQATPRIDDYAKDGGKELFTNMHCILVTNSQRFYRNSIKRTLCILVKSREIKIYSSLVKISLKFPFQFCLSSAPPANPVFGIHDPIGLSFLTQLRVGLSKLSFHKLKHNLGHTVNSMCPSNDGIENAEHFLLCLSIDAQRRDFLAPSL